MPLARVARDVTLETDGRRSKRPIGFFVVERKDRDVLAADRSQHAAPNHVTVGGAGRFDRCLARNIGKESRQSRQHAYVASREPYAAGLVVEVHHRRDEAGVRAARHRIAQRPKAVLVDDVVVGGRVDVLAGGGGDTLIDRVRSHVVFSVGDDAYGGKVAPEHLDGAVARGVVDDDDFVGQQVAAIDRLEQALHLVAPVVGDDDDADARRAHAVCPMPNAPRRAPALRAARAASLR